MATSAPVECTFIVNGQPCRFWFSPLNLREVEQINLHVRAKLIRAAREALVDCANEKEKQDTLDSAMRVASEINFFGTSRHFSSIDVVAYVFALAMQRHKENGIIQQQEWMDILAADENTEEFKFAWHVLHGKATARPQPQEPETNPTIAGAALGNSMQQPSNPQATPLQTVYQQPVNSI